MSNKKQARSRNWLVVLATQTLLTEHLYIHINASLTDIKCTEPSTFKNTNVVVQAQKMCNFKTSSILAKIVNTLKKKNSRDCNTIKINFHI